MWNTIRGINHKWHFHLIIVRKRVQYCCTALHCNLLYCTTEYCMRQLGTHLRTSIPFALWEFRVRMECTKGRAPHMSGMELWVCPARVTQNWSCFLRRPLAAAHEQFVLELRAEARMSQQLHAVCCTQIDQRYGLYNSSGTPNLCASTIRMMQESGPGWCWISSGMSNDCNNYLYFTTFIVLCISSSFCENDGSAQFHLAQFFDTISQQIKWLLGGSFLFVNLQTDRRHNTSA